MTARSRLASLDAFRGFAIAGMVLVNNPGSWKYVHRPLDHAEWHGCTFTDLIFPFFLFAAGLSMAISLGRKAREGSGRWTLLRGVLRRAAILFLIGVLLNLVPSFQLATLRIPGVLQRIALTIMVASPVAIWGRWRAALAAIAALFGLYLALMLLVPVPGADGLVAAGRLRPGQDFGAWLDRLVFGHHLWAKAKTWDPEGLVGTLPATASLLMGLIAGHYLASPARRVRKSLGLCLAGGLLLALGALMGAAFMPINKNLWTPSFALYTGGWSMALLAAFHALLDEGAQAWSTVARRASLPLVIYGMNALFLFIFSGVIARILQSVHGAGGAGAVTLKEWLFAGLARLPLSLENASLAYALLFNLAMFAVAWVMWRHKWFIKI